MNLGHLMLNHMKAATEKKKQGLPYGMFFTHMFHALEVDMTGEVREKPKESKEYNKKTLRLMGFIQNEDGEWVRKGVVTPHKEGAGGSESEKRVKMRKRKQLQEPNTSTDWIFLTRATGSSHEPRLNSIEASMDEIKEEQKRLARVWRNWPPICRRGLKILRRYFDVNLVKNNENQQQ
ncbi:hypothetical protein CJ030_MR4G013724 [Morella rubra]|uniref:Uncharacterized protein n=1 Tax=Morella rubra TaxID=262757 RepID=A0A6A1WS74_9ROSI|nr:hypothetical protein CJ030_MR4G013724 [Morella rubra]